MKRNLSSSRVSARISAIAASLMLSSCMMTVDSSTPDRPEAAQQGRSAVSLSSDSIPGSPTESRLLLGTRWTISSIIDDIFGATTVASGNVTVKQVEQSFILDQTTSWGGACDPYADSFPMPYLSTRGDYTEDKIEKPSVRGCAEANQSQASLIPAGSTSRFAWTIRTCDRVISSDAAVRFAATQAGYPAGSAMTVAPNDNYIREVFDLFHPGVEMPDSSIVALRAVVNEAASRYPNTNEAWRFLLLTVCQSPGWQVF